MTGIVNGIVVVALIGVLSISPAPAQTTVDPPAGGTMSGSGGGDGTSGGAVDVQAGKSAVQSPGDGTIGGGNVSNDADQAGSDLAPIVKLTDEQRSKIKDAVKEANVPPAANLNFAVAIGTAVPKSVRLTPVPQQVGSMLPGYRDYLFFLLPDGRIAIVNPHSHAIVTML